MSTTARKHDTTQSHIDQPNQIKQNQIFVCMELVQWSAKSEEVIQIAALNSTSKEIFHQICTPQSSLTYNLPAQDKYLKHLGLQKTVRDGKVSFLLQVMGCQYTNFIICVQLLRIFSFAASIPKICSYHNVDLLNYYTLSLSSLL